MLSVLEMPAAANLGGLPSPWGEGEFRNGRSGQDWRDTPTLATRAVTNESHTPKAATFSY